MNIYTSAGAMLVVSIVASFLLVKRNRSLDQQVVKIMMFGLYFWVFTFIQAVVYALIYQFAFK